MRAALFLTLLCLGGTARAQWKELGTLPGGATAWEYQTTLAGGPVRVSGVSFTAGPATFKVIDNPPDNRKSLATALAGAGAPAGINGGYFHPDFKPLGLEVSDGTMIHSFERAKLLSGVLAVRGNRLELVRADAFKMGPDVREALQAGPWLLADGTPVPGLNAERLARRTVVATDGKNHWAIFTTSSLTLAGTAELLGRENVTGSWKIRNALNLDGGSSTSLVAIQDGRLLLNIPSFGPVRNYLAIVPAGR